jgi:hypothetical protein
MEATVFLKEKFNISLEACEAVCQFSDFNKECLQEKCKFHFSRHDKLAFKEK